MKMSMSEITSKLPTHVELRAIIEKIAEFFEKIVKLFDELQAGLAETYSKYVRVYGNDDTTVVDEVE